MTFIYIGAAITLGTLAGILAYLYREGAILSGKSQVGLGPIQFKLADDARLASGTAEPGKEAEGSGR